MAAETGFRIDGEICEVPAWDTLTLDERYVLFEYAQIAQEDFIQDEDESDTEYEERTTKLMKHPGFWPALQHIAYRRKRPEITNAKVKRLIAAANADLLSRAETMEPVAGPDEDDANPPASTTEPSESSERSSVDSNTNSGAASESDTDAQVVPLARTTDGSSPPSESTPAPTLSVH